MNSYFASLGPALANHLWQSTAVGLLAWLLTLTLRRAQARLRYSIWLAASIKFLVPFSLLISAGNLLPQAQQPVAPVVYSTMDAVEEPFTADVPRIVDAPIRIPSVRERVAAALPMGLGILWLLGVGTVLFAWWNRWRVVARSAKQATPAEEGRELKILRRLEAGAAHPVALLMSAERMEPGIVGVLRPVLVWPAQLSACLDDQHIEAIVAHELTHVRRRDNLTALVHMLVEAAFWFHPLVWWMERQMVKEREQACDEAVVEMGGSAETYAESLLKTCWFCIESPLPCVAGVTGADLKRRVADIMTGRALLRMTWPKKLLLAAVAVSALLAPVLLGQAKAAQRLMQSAIKMAPKPVGQMAAHATEETSEISASAAQEPTANDSDSGAAFDVATIRPMNDKDRHWFGFRIAPSGRLTVSAVPLDGLVGFSSTVSGDVSGGPAWAESQKWDIVAEADTSKIPNWNQLSDEERMNRIKPMLRKLVVERFHLKGHTESRIYDVHAMVPAKHGVKLGGAFKRADPPPAHTDPDELDARLRSNKPIIGPPAQGFRFDPNGTWWFRSVRPNFLALQLAALCRIDGRAVDQSGLEGYYDLTFKPDSDPDAPSLQDQVEVQLGLRFEAKKVPLPTYVIDSAEKPSVDGAEVQPATDSEAASVATSATGPVFTVSTVKPSNPANSGSSGIYTGHGRLDGKNVTLKRAIIGAYNVGPHQVVGGPDWVDTLRWDIQGKADQDITDGATLDAMQAALIADRFKLVMHKETRTVPAYVLEINKNGPKLAKGDGGESQTDMRTGTSGKVTLRISNTDMNRFAAVLARRMDLPVVNETGLKGAYNFELAWTPDDTKAASAPDALSIFTAIQEQLGLRLRSAKAPVEVLVIDHAQMPVGN